LQRKISYSSHNLPTIRNTITDVDIPRSAWSTWTETGKRPMLRRALNDAERSALEARRDELEPAIEGYGERDVTRVALALTDMLGGFGSRQDDASVIGRVDSLRRFVEPFPAWAIERVCRNVRSDGYLRDGKVERHWPPTDSELVHLIREAVAPYVDRHDAAVALLAAEVER
jgi:hypothetical protein